MYCIKNANIVLENGILWNGVLLTEGDRIVAAGSSRGLSIPAEATIIDAAGAYVGPGFVDIHVHGGETFAFDKEPEQAAAHYLRHGETTILPTLYCDLTVEGYLASVQRIRDTMSMPGAGEAIAGIYMEGPFMNPQYGAAPESNKWRGSIDPDRYRPVVDAAGDLARVWTIAPERDGIEEFVRYVITVNPDAVFSVGHSEATPSQVRKLKRYGLSLQTHCMDATGRKPTWGGTRGAGPDEACLTDPDMYAEVICDSHGVHVNPDLIRLILHAKGLERTVLITDGTCFQSEAPEGLRHITDLNFDSNQGISGSRLTMDVACRNLMTHTNCGIAQAFLLASRNPARVIGLDDEIGTIEAGKKANLVFVDDQFRVKRVMLNGIIR